MPARPRRPLVALLIAGGALTVAPTAGAATVTLRASGASAARCHARALHGPGVARRSVDARAGTLVAARLHGGHGNWDLGVLDAHGRSLGGAAVPGSDDLAQAPVRHRGRVTVQACRRPGASHAVRLTITSVPLSGSSRARLTAPRPDKDDRLLAAAVRARHAVAHSARRAVRLPSGRRSYRQLDDYEADLQTLATEHPGSVRELVLPRPTLIGRRIVGVEIARHVRRRDGRPVMLITGLHHAREWPSGEMTIEWAIDLARALARHDPTVTRLLSRARVIAVPVVNPDGFFLSRSVGGALAAKRKNCRVADGQVPRPGQCESAADAGLGVDINRNYGGFWGGPGASLDPADDTYRGAAPFSEPETQDMHELIEARQVTVAISNDTYGNLLLRPPSLRDAAPPDAAALKQLGDEIAAPAGLVSERGYDLYDTSGAMEDWSYWATGGLAFTAELGDGSSSTLTGLRPFHPPFAQVASWYPGLRRSFDRALAWTADPAHHAVIHGHGPAGATIELSKVFRTATAPVLGSDGLAGAPLSFPDRLHSSLVIGRSGRFAFHANPSTRPSAMGRPGRAPEGPATAGVPISSPGTTVSFAYGLNNAIDAPARARVDTPFTIAPGDDDAEVTARISWADPRNDFDLYVFRINADGSQTALAASAEANTTWEQTEVVPDTPDGRLPAGRYVARVIDYASTNKAFSGQITFAGPSPPVPATPERWTLTCRRAGRTLSTREVLVDRGASVGVGAACSS